MPRQSFIVLELVFRKLEKTITAAFLCRVRVSEHLWESWDVDMSVEQHGYDCSYALARESPPVTLRKGALKKGSWLVQGFACTFVCLILILISYHKQFQHGWAPPCSGRPAGCGLAVLTNIKPLY